MQFPNEGEVAGRVLNAATNRVRDVYEALFGDILEVSGSGPRERFDYALQILRERVRNDRVEADAETIDEILNEDELFAGLHRGIDYVSPAAFKDAVWDECLDLCRTGESRLFEMPLRTFLRRVYDQLGLAYKWKKRLHVRQNADFRRAWAWLLECSENWLDEDGNSAISFRNARRGPVAASPQPDKVIVKLRRDYFREFD